MQQYAIDTKPGQAGIAANALMFIEESTSLLLITAECRAHDVIGRLS